MTQESLSKRYKSLLLLSSLALVLLLFMVVSIGTAYYFYRKSLDSVDGFSVNSLGGNGANYQAQKLAQGNTPKHTVSLDDSDYNAQPESTGQPLYDDYELPAPLAEMMVGDRKSKVNTAFMKYNADIKNNDTSINKNNNRKNKMFRKVDKSKGLQQDDASVYNADSGKYGSFKEAHNKKIMECLNLTYPIILVSKLETQLQLADMKPHKQRQYRKEILERIYKLDYNDNISAGMRVVSAMTHYLSLTNDLDGLYLFVELVKELSKVADDSSIYTNLEKGFKYSKGQQGEDEVGKGTTNDRRRTNRETKHRKNKHKNKNGKINETKTEKELEDDLEKLQRIRNNHPKSFDGRHDIENYESPVKDTFNHDAYNGQSEYDSFNRVVDSIHNNDNYHNKNGKVKTKNKGRFDDKKHNVKNSYYKLADPYDIYGGNNGMNNYFNAGYNRKHIGANGAGDNQRSTNKNSNLKNNFQGFHKNVNENSYMYNNNNYDNYDKNRYQNPHGNNIDNPFNYHRWNDDGRVKQWRNDKYDVVGNNMIGSRENSASYKNNIFYHGSYMNNEKNLNPNRNNYFNNNNFNQNNFQQNYKDQNGHLSNQNTERKENMYGNIREHDRNNMYTQHHNNFNQFNDHRNTDSNYLKSNKDYPNDGTYKHYNEHRYAITNRPTYMNYDPKPLTNHHHLGKAYHDSQQFYNYPFQANNGHNANQNIKNNEQNHEKSEIEEKKEKLDKIITEYFN